MCLRPYLDVKPLGLLSNMKLRKQQQKGACVHLGSKCSLPFCTPGLPVLHLSVANEHHYRGVCHSAGTKTVFFWSHFFKYLPQPKKIIDVNQIHVLYGP